MRWFTGSLAILVLLGCGGAARAADGAVELQVDVPEPELAPARDGQTRVRVRGAGTISRPGQPALPVRVLRIAVPPDADASSVRVEVSARAEQAIEGRFDVRPAPPMAQIGTRKLSWGAHAARIVEGRDAQIYGSSELYPGEWFVASDGLGQARRYRFVTLYLYPVRYRPTDGTLVRAGGFDVRVSYDTGRSSIDWRLDDCGADRLASELLDNFHEARGWYPPQCFGPPSGPPGVAIITTAELEAGSDLLDDYILMREGEGYELTVATEADWDVTTGDVFDERADRIRLWIQENVEGLDLGWVILMGNPDPGADVPNSIPMKSCGMNNDNDRGPTDFYYADISGSWDASGNGIQCEFGFDSADLYGTGTIDFVPEVYIGRYPSYSDGAAAIDDALAKTIAYEEETAGGDLEWRRRMMLPNSIYFFDGQYGQAYHRWDGATVGEWFIREQLEPRGMVWTTLYEHEGLDTSQFASHFQVDTFNTVDQWVRGYGFVFWTGHGSSSGVYRTVWWDDENDNQVADWQEMGGPEFMGTSYLHMLEDAPPAFVVHGSCSNGEPETASNLGYNLLRRGAIGTVSASRPAYTWHYPNFDPEIWEKPESWDGDVVDIVSEYAVNLIGGSEAGRALGDAIAATDDGHGDSSWYQKSIQNLYGDPLVRLVMCRDDSECDNGLYCDGEELCDDGTCVAGTPVDCEELLGCEDVVCREGAGCLPGPTCGDAPDAGADDAGTPPPGPVGITSKSSCSATPVSASGSSLLSLIAGSI